MLTSLISLQQGNVKKSKKAMKIVSIEGESLHIFWTTWGLSMEFSEKTWLMIILKFTKKAGFHSLSLSLSLSRKIIFRKAAEEVQTNLLAFLGRKILSWKIAPGVRSEIFFQRRLMRLLCLLCKAFSTSRPTYICNLFPSMGNSHHQVIRLIHWFPMHHFSTP